VRILHVDTGRELRGGQHQVLLLMNGLRSAGHENVLLAHRESPLWQRAKADGFPVYPATFAKLWRRSRHVDLVHAHDARAHSMAAVACRNRFVVSRRVGFPVGGSLLSRWKYRRPARFLAVSQFVTKQLKSAGVPSEKIDLVYDAVEIQQAADVWSPEYPAVALASLDPQKGRVLVEEAAKLASIPVIYSDNLPEALRRASMLVYITRSEGLGSAALLAMAMGVPVIGSAVDGLAELLSDGVGLLVPNDAAEIGRAMVSLRNDPALAHVLIERGRARVEQQFTMRHLVQAVLKSYERTLAG
jgi:glycosyltransferase involved in cell wall biosynthesis